MARMIPAVIDPERSPPGEVGVFQLLRDEAPDDWTVLHSLDLAQHVVQISGEVDFVILIPGVAVICLEVKSHRRVIRDSAGMWRLGQDMPTERSPFRQASEAMHSIRNRVAKRNSLSSVPFISAVAFPRSRFEVAAAEWEPWQVFDESAVSVRGIAACLIRVGTEYRAKLEDTPTATWFSERKQQPTYEQCALLTETLRPTFEQSRSPKARRRAAEEEIRKYTGEQFDALDSIEDNDRVVFTGAAGTGKTFLAIEAARRAALSGDRVLLCCYNRLLGQWLTREARPLAPEVEAGTLHSQMLSLAKIDVPQNSPSEFWTEELPEAALNRLIESDLPAQYDHLIIDEAQDICTDPYLSVLDLMIKGGLAHGQWLAFGDFEHQTLYTDNKTLNRIRSVAEHSSFSLGINCRNRPAVGMFAGYASGQNPYKRFRRPEDGFKADLVAYDNIDDQTSKLVAAIETLRNAGHQAGEIAVLSTRAFGASSRLAAPQSSWLAPATSSRGHKVADSTIHAFKGLEAPAIIVTDIDDLDSDSARQLLYVAASRATERLVVLYNERVRTQLANLMIGTP